MELLELKVKDEEKAFAWNTVISEKQWRDYARLAWEISPVLAVFFPSRSVMLIFLYQSNSSE
jgi:phosphatidylinositol 4-kinase